MAKGRVTSGPRGRMRTNIRCELTSGQTGTEERPIRVLCNPENTEAHLASAPKPKSIPPEREPVSSGGCYSVVQAALVSVHRQKRWGNSPFTQRPTGAREQAMYSQVDSNAVQPNLMVTGSLPMAGLTVIGFETSNSNFF
ncbi:conserved hypothetical protein [Coccidioides posadasii str. Silveira]|uniref:Uncharacterized protein n=1 Tax=Coccidioides posadasii (strain RMSCC 757 / Silveira) TaxID=443226 RepID=E9D7D3_COCPS|nr:conserved hypothetical protein [Coccidioides posadasii str. Silveira]